MRLHHSLLGLSLLVGSALSASADTVVLKFENILTAGQQSAPIGDYYNGTGGPSNNYGISFSDNALALCLNTPGNSCSNTSRGGLGDPTSQGGGLFFLSGSETYMNNEAGFTDGFSLFYSAINQPGSLSVYSGLNGTGTLLATLDLSLTSSGCSGIYDAGFCPFVPVGVSFSGTAESISFAGAANQIVFDDVTFGSAIPNPPDTSAVPEPSTLLMMFTGAGAAIGGVRRRIAMARS
ncbi:MAG: PEP-CTERM sorting domain-containing protein [Edaphobacter sp.]|uniref:PEP-CTERM sorting domain-containing protein n=1 Tax=Edaphobacter sp. TaxID=1934404 RepID=UPI00238EB48D|nr:PEP-CTERM sorting domain-containing protein [Edaphobacter sp.]MDE1177044.1 PEP-CTERM sorting domain-containing protein [Edaphobacter sp.]